MITIDLDGITIVTFLIAAALVVLAIWAPGPLRDHRGKLGAGILGLVAFALGRSTKSGTTGERGDATGNGTPNGAPSGPSENKPLTDALDASDAILTEAEHATPDSPYSDLDDDALRRALESATGTGSE